MSHVPPSPHEISAEGRQSTVQQAECGIVTPECPCVGHCSTVLGDDVCRGCQRTLEEVILWPQLTEEQRCAVNRRIALEKWEKLVS